MENAVWWPIATCVIAALVTILLCRRRGWLGLPVAYMFNLLLIHVPGAYAAGLGATGYFTSDIETIATGIRLTAIASVCFVAGLLLAQRLSKAGLPGVIPKPVPRNFLFFCVIGGWVFAIAMSPLKAIPSIGAAVVFGSSIWILGVVLGLLGAMSTRHVGRFLTWSVALLVYPLVMLIFGGFIGYGAIAILTTCAILLVHLKSKFVALLIAPVIFILGISIFVNYFENRSALREVLWSTATFDERIDAIGDTFGDFRLFDAKRPTHLKALTLRLNQNEFVGIAAKRLENGQVDFLYGRSFYEGLIAVVPRAIWPDKPVYGGSPVVVSEMTGLNFNKNTSWGVGNVMEFYINFGLPSLVFGFVLLGLFIGWLDRRAYLFLVNGRPGDSLLYFLPGVALIQPNGSLVELTGGAAAALAAAFGWRYLWLNSRRRAGAQHRF